MLVCVCVCTGCMTLVELPVSLCPREGDVTYAVAERLQNQLYHQFNIEVSGWLCCGPCHFSTLLVGSVSV